MNNLSKYIIEKLHLNKDIELSKYQDFYGELNSYLEDKSYFNYNKNEFNYTESKWNGYDQIILHLLKSFKLIYLNEIEDDIVNLHKNEKQFNTLNFLTKDFKEPHITFTMN